MTVHIFRYMRLNRIIETVQHDLLLESDDNEAVKTSLFTGTIKYWNILISCLLIFGPISNTGISDHLKQVSSPLTNIPLIETVDYICDFITENHLNTEFPTKTLWLDSSLHHQCPITTQRRSIQTHRWGSHGHSPRTITDRYFYVKVWKQ